MGYPSRDKWNFRISLAASVRRLNQYYPYFLSDTSQPGVTIYRDNRLNEEFIFAYFRIIEMHHDLYNDEYCIKTVMVDTNGYHHDMDYNYNDGENLIRLSKGWEWADEEQNTRILSKLKAGDGYTGMVPSSPYKCTYVGAQGTMEK